MLVIPIVRPFNTFTLNFPDRAIFVKTAKFWVGHRVGHGPGHGQAQVLYTPVGGGIACPRAKGCIQNLG